MPYRLHGSRVYKVLPDGTLKLVPGGDHHGDHAAALAHFRALKMNVGPREKRKRAD